MTKEELVAEVRRAVLRGDVKGHLCDAIKDYNKQEQERMSEALGKAAEGRGPYPALTDKQAAEARNRLRKGESYGDVMESYGYEMTDGGIADFNREIGEESTGYEGPGRPPKPGRRTGPDIPQHCPPEELIADRRWRVQAAQERAEEAQKEGKDGYWKKELNNAKKELDRVMREYGKKPTIPVTAPKMIQFKPPLTK